MRNWHQKIIKLDEALELIEDDNRVVIAVSEGQVEFESLSTDPLNELNYRARSRGLFKIVGDVQKSSLIGQSGGNVTANIPLTEASAHATSVSGIILASARDSDDILLPIRGIVEDAELMNISTNYLYQVLSTIDNFKYFMNDGSAVIDPAFELSTFNFTHGTSRYIPPRKQPIVLNASYTLKLSTPAAVALYNVIFKTCKAYSNNGRGVLFVAAAGNSNSDTLTVQHYGKLPFPLIVAASTIDDKKVFEEISEFRSSYSCYGDRVDLCGPSNGNKKGIYSTTNLKCGEIGFDDEVVLKTITNQSQNDSFTLNNTDQVFPGNCIEVGLPNTVNHEILIVKEVNRSTNTIKFIESRYYTRTPFVISPASIKIPILKSNATMPSDSASYRAIVFADEETSTTGASLSILSAMSENKSSSPMLPISCMNWLATSSP